MNKFLKDYLYNLSILAGFFTISAFVITILFFVGSILFKFLGLTAGIIGVIVIVILIITAFITAVSQY